MDDTPPADPAVKPDRLWDRRLIAWPPGHLGRVQGIAATTSAGNMPPGRAQAGIVFDPTGKNVPRVYSVPPGVILLVALLGLLCHRHREFTRSQGVPPDPAPGTR